MVALLYTLYYASENTNIIKQKTSINKIRKIFHRISSNKLRASNKRRHLISVAVFGAHIEISAVPQN